VEVENNMTSVERMVEYMNLPSEPPRWASIPQSQSVVTVALLVLEGVGQRDDSSNPDVAA
jgi:hypothetical protein